MADRTELFPVTVPANTAQATPQVTALAFPDGVVTALEFIIPPGPSGLVGWQIRYNGQVIIPRKGNGFFVMDNTHESWPLTNYPTGGGWQLAAYNTDTYSHLLQFIFHIDELHAPAARPLTLAPIV